MAEAEQSALHPTKAAPQVRNGRKGHFLYATHRLDQGYLYALPFPGPGSFARSFMSTLDPLDSDSALTRFHGDRSERVRSEVFSHKIYAMSSEGFEQVTSNPREWIIDRSVEEVHLVAQVTNLDQVLEQGVQYFTMSNDAPIVPIASPLFDILEHAAQKNELTAELLAHAIAGNSHVVWENEVDGLGVDPKLARLVDARRLVLLEERIGRPVSTELVDSLARSRSALAVRSDPTPDELSAALASAFFSTFDDGGAKLPSTLIPPLDTPRGHAERMDIKAALSMVDAILSQYEGSMLSEKRVKAWTAEKLPTCATLIVCEGSVLMCRQTGRGRWDFPKGMMDEGESPVHGALRELKEETRLLLDPLATHDLGSHPFVPKQRMCAFAFEAAPGTIDLAALRCESWVEPCEGSAHFERFPEVDAYEWVPLSELKAGSDSKRPFVYGLREVFNNHLHSALAALGPGLAGAGPAAPAGEPLSSSAGSEDKVTPIERQIALDAQLVDTIFRADPAGAKAALAVGANVDALDMLGNTAIVLSTHQAANWATESQKRCLALLIDSGANVNAIGASGQSACMVAAFLGNSACLKTLVAAGADVNALSSKGQTALMMAATEGIKDMLGSLMNAGVPVDSLVNFGRSALMPTASVEYDKCIKILIESGALLDATDSRGCTALMAAAARGKTMTLKTLVAAGAHLDTVGHDGLSALGMARKSSNEEVSLFCLNAVRRIRLLT